MVKYESGNFYDKNWSETVGTYSGEAVIPDEETALKIAKAIFSSTETETLRHFSFSPRFIASILWLGIVLTSCLNPAYVS